MLREFQKLDASLFACLFLSPSVLCLPVTVSLFLTRGGGGGGGGAVDQSVERATPGEEVPGSIPPVAAHSLLAGSVSV